MTMNLNSPCSQGDLFLPRPEAGKNPLVLKIQGLIPGKKNNKMIVTKGPKGRPLPRPFLITKPEYQEALKKITESLRFQLLSAFRTPSGETLTGSNLRSLIAYSVPADDAWTHIPVLSIQGTLCEPGQESAIVIIQRLN